MSTVSAVTGETFEDEVIKSEMPVVVDLWAEWCQPCKAMLPIVDATAADFEGKIKFVKLDVQNDPGIASKYGVSSIPTLLIFKAGEVTDRVVGLQSKQMLAEKLNQILG